MQRLDPGKLLRLERAAGTHIAVCAGLVWLTESGKHDDVFLGAGQGYVVTGPGRVVIEPLGKGRAAMLEITTPGRRPSPCEPVTPMLAGRIASRASSHAFRALAILQHTSFLNDRNPRSLP